VERVVGGRWDNKRKVGCNMLVLYKQRIGLKKKKK